MTETGQLPEGIVVDGRVCRDFVIDEQRFRHTLEIMNDPASGEKVEDPVWFSAALLARRLSVVGVDRVTPEMVLDLSGPDGDELTRATLQLEQRRREFRSSAQAGAETSDSPSEDGVE